MSWSAAGVFVKDLFRSKWMKDQAPHVVVLFCILFMVGGYVFLVRPAERAEERAAEERLVASIKEGYRDQELKQGIQLDRVIDDRDAERRQSHELIQALLEGKVAGTAQAIREISGLMSANVSAEGEGSEGEEDR